MKNTYRRYLIFFSSITLFFIMSSYQHSHSYTKKDTVSEDADSPKDTYEEYVNFFEEVFKVMQDNYYQDVTREQFDRFLKQFDEKIYGSLTETNKSVDYIRWRSTALMVDALKTSEDVFSGFYPPKPAKEYEETALGVRVDLGIDGEKIDQGFLVKHVEPRSDAYMKGLRDNDLVVRLNGQNTLELTTEKSKELLRPLQEETVTIDYVSHIDRVKNSIEVTPTEFYRQTVFEIPLSVEGYHGVEIRRFNRKTAEDLFRFIKFFKQKGEMKGLVIDLRGNPGGPPLAAREISSFFLPAGQEFAYFQKKGQPKAVLDVPEIPGEFKYDGPIVILIDEKSGSSSELFSGVLQRRKRAILMGENSAGQVMLKSMFHFDDDSMVLLITSRGHHPDGGVFSFDGLTPDRRITEDIGDDIIKYAVTYLIYINKQENEG